MSEEETLAPDEQWAIPQVDHELIVGELKNEIAQLKNENRKLNESVASTNAALKVAMQKLHFFYNAYADLPNIIKGQMISQPNAHKDAMMTVDSWWMHMKDFFNISKMIHKRKWPSFPTIVAGIIVLMITGAALGNPVGAGQFIHDNAGLLGALIVVVGLSVFFIRRRKEVPR